MILILADIHAIIYFTHIHMYLHTIRDVFPAEKKQNKKIIQQRNQKSNQKASPLRNE